MQPLAALLSLLCLARAAGYRLAAGVPPHANPATAATAAHSPQMVLRIAPHAASDALALPGLEGAEASKGPFGKGGALEWLATATDALAAVTLAGLHAFDDKAVQDSSKNLQVMNPNLDHHDPAMAPVQARHDATLTTPSPHRHPTATPPSPLHNPSITPTATTPPTPTLHPTPPPYTLPPYTRTLNPPP